MDGAIIQN